ncbi:hypothetical protein Kpho02_47270 [Kitasatospora phosalacinea]|uniref:Uncharacterized protein n=1 Tax=Kitasatospora phosalacinea TaxID=2065 RepID=A0A9W6QCK9_9ACTN|nr:hypothetical protein Kpho02_47270 [Kitasatospora phosalacinea]
MITPANSTIPETQPLLGGRWVALAGGGVAVGPTDELMEPPRPKQVLLPTLRHPPPPGIRATPSG